MDTEVGGAEPGAGAETIRLGGRYRVGRLLGRGGAAEVYDGFDERLARPIAIKVLSAMGAATPGMPERFAREGRAAARLSHPCAVAVYDSGQDRARAFIVMERLPGDTLADRIARGPVAPLQMAVWATDVLAALAAAHAMGMVHRDVKPANILLTADGRAKLADFGIAVTGVPGELTATGLVVGTAAYLAPERIAGAAATPRSDLYALGVVLYEGLTGRKPFDWNTPGGVRQEPNVASLGAVASPQLQAVVRRALATRPEDRYPSAISMSAALAAAAGLPVGAPAGIPGAPDQTRLLPAEGADKDRRRPRRLTARGPLLIGGATTLALVAALVAALLAAGPSSPCRTIASTAPPPTLTPATVAASEP
ncbi:MAG: serine/threonine-protein kinase, partial [Acidimicrobiales bacterium]